MTFNFKVYILIIKKKENGTSFLNLLDVKKMSITARSYSRILKVSRTIADMDNAKSIELKHVLESLQYRSLERLKAFLG